MTKGRLFLATGLTATVLLMGAWSPSTSLTDYSGVVASGDAQEKSVPTILPPL